MQSGSLQSRPVNNLKALITLSSHGAFTLRLVQISDPDTDGVSIYGTKHAWFQSTFKSTDETGKSRGAEGQACRECLVI